MTFYPGYTWRYRPWGYGAGFYFGNWSLYNWGPGYGYYGYRPNPTIVVVNQQAAAPTANVQAPAQPAANLPPPMLIPQSKLKKLEYDGNSWHDRWAQVEKDGLYFFKSHGDTVSSGWVPFLFDSVAYPVPPDTEHKAVNSTALSHSHTHNIQESHCFKVIGCDPERQYMARTYYLIAANDQERDQFIHAINFNITAFCENEEGAKEYVNRLVSTLALTNNGTLPSDVDAQVATQLDTIRTNRAYFLPPPPAGMTPPQELVKQWPAQPVAGAPQPAQTQLVQPVAAPVVQPIVQ